MYQNKKFIFVCCGAGKLTSFMAAEGLRKGLKEIGIDMKKLKITHGMMHDIGRYEKILIFWLAQLITKEIIVSQYLME